MRCESLSLIHRCALDQSTKTKWSRNPPQHPLISLIIRGVSFSCDPVSWCFICRLTLPLTPHVQSHWGSNHILAGSPCAVHGLSPAQAMMFHSCLCCLLVFFPHVLGVWYTRSALKQHRESVGIVRTSPTIYAGRESG